MSLANTPQAVTERRSAEAEVRALVDQLAPAHLRLVRAARKWLLEHLPTAHELVYEYSDALVISYAPKDQGHEGVFALRATADGVTLYFNQGKGLPDPHKLLQGSGKQVRFVKLSGASTLARPEVLSLVDEAISRNPVPYALAGRGSLLIRSTSAKKRRLPQK